MKKILWVILNILLILSILPYNTFALDYDLDMGEIKKNKITVNSVGNGVATANMLEADLDETITLTATPYSSSLFLGWYEGDNLLSNSTTYNVNITKDTTFTAKFTDNNILADKNTSNNWVSTGYTQFAPSNETRYGGKGVVFSGVRYQVQYFKMNLAPNREYSIQFSIKSDIVLNCVYILNNTAIFSDKSSGGIIKNSSCCVEKTLLNATNKDISSWTDLSITFKTNHSQNATDTYYLYLKFSGTSNSEILENKAYVSDLSLIEKGNSFIAFNGNAIRSTGNQGLRYTYKLADNLLTDGYYGYKVKEIGALAIKNLYLGTKMLEKNATYTYNQKTYTPTLGIFYNKENNINNVSDKGTVAALLYNIGYNKSNKTIDYSAYANNYTVRVYMDIDYNGKTLTVYNDMNKASIFAVIDTIIESYKSSNPTPTEGQLFDDYQCVQSFLLSDHKDKNNKTINQTYTTNITDVALNAPAVLINPTENEYQDGKRQWQGIPSIAKDNASGRLWATWYSGGSGEGNSNWSILYTSDDDGETWSGPKVVVNPEHPCVRSYDPNLWVDPNGRLWFFWNQSYTYFDGRCGVWAMYTDNPSAENPTWSEPTRIANGIAMNDPVVLADGSWLLPTSIWRPDRLILETSPIIRETSDDWYYINKNYKLMGDEVNANVYISKNNGASWSYHGSVKGYEGKAEFDEHMIAQRSDGSLIMAIRTASGLQESYSIDGGITWTDAVHTGVTNVSSRFYLAKLKSGNLLLVYNNPPNNGSGRSHMTAAISTDDGNTWSYKLVINELSGTSYPDAFEDEDGNIYITYDYGRGVNGNILMTKITESDIMAEKIITDGSFVNKLINDNTVKTNN